MSSDKMADNLLNTMKAEVVKVFKVYDGSNRVIEQYEAVANAVNNAPCIKTTYTYVGATNQVEKMKEERGIWLSSYDI